jgi:hypothetical protein
MNKVVTNTVLCDIQNVSGAFPRFHPFKKDTTINHIIQKVNDKNYNTHGK